MTRQRIRVLLVAAALFALPIQPGARADSGPEAAKAPGEVNFAISCGPDAQKTFKQAVWTLHSFWYPEALKAFTAITEAEPGCAMGYWGIAMSHWYPLWYPPSPAALKAGSDAVEKAVAAGPKTEREKDYIAAIATFYRDNDKLDHQTRATRLREGDGTGLSALSRGPRGRGVLWAGAERLGAAHRQDLRQ